MRAGGKQSRDDVSHDEVRITVTSPGAIEDGTRTMAANASSYRGPEGVKVPVERDDDTHERDRRIVGWIKRRCPDFDQPFEFERGVPTLAAIRNRIADGWEPVYVDEPVGSASPDTGETA